MYIAFCLARIFIKTLLTSNNIILKRKKTTGIKRFLVDLNRFFL